MPEKLTPDQRRQINKAKASDKKYQLEQQKKAMERQEKEDQERIAAYEPLNFKKDEKEINELLESCRITPKLVPTWKMSYNQLDTPDISIQIEGKDNMRNAVDNIHKLSDQIYMCNEAIELTTGRMDDFIHLFSHYAKSRDLGRYVASDYQRFDCADIIKRHSSILVSEDIKKQCSEYDKYLSKLKEVIPESISAATKYMTKIVDEYRRVSPITSQDINKADLNMTYNQATERWRKIKDAPYHYLGVP